MVLQLSEDIAILKGKDRAKSTHTLNRKKVSGGDRKSQILEKEVIVNIMQIAKLKKGKDRDNVSVVVRKAESKKEMTGKYKWSSREKSNLI